MGLHVLVRLTLLAKPTIPFYQRPEFKSSREQSVDCSCVTTSLPGSGNQARFNALITVP